MRPHRLCVTAFGPFAGTVEVDLDALATGGLFLLQGETGAGKTTLLDAMGFALYGRVPGERGKARRLRSDHADIASRTTVQLEVTIAGRRLRITRSPEQPRPRLRGNGVTTEPAKMLLEEAVSSSWVVRSTRVDEASREITELMGMSAEQFFQVVLLPQNDFARFLRASSEERGQLLERLFGTDRFSRAEDWLADRRRAGSAALDAARVSVTLLAARLAQAVGVESPTQPFHPGEVQALVAASAAEAEAAEVEVVARQALFDAAGAGAVELRALRDRQRRRAAALARDAGLAAEAAEMATLSRQVEWAARAAGVVRVVTEADRRQVAQQQARRQERAARRPLRDLDVDPDADVAVLRAAVEAYRYRVARLESLRAVADTAVEEQGAAERSRVEAAALGTELAGCAEALAALPEHRRKFTAAVDAAREAEMALPEARGQVANLRSACSDAATLADAVVAVQRLTGDLLDARTTEVDLRRRAVTLRERRVDGMIAELAASLEDDTPCPVCGSLRHPEPSDVRGERVTRDEEESAFAAAESAAAHAGKIEAVRASRQATAEVVSARLTEGGYREFDAAALGASMTSAEAVVARLSTVAAGLSRADAGLAALDGQQQTLESDRASLRERQRAAELRAADALGRAETARRRLFAELGGAADLDAALAAAEHALALLDGAVLAVVETSRTAEEAVGSAAAAVLRAAEAGFEDVTAVRAALRDEEWREKVVPRIEAHRAARAAVADQLADPALAVRLEPPADVEGAEVALLAAQAALGDAQRRHSVRAQRAEAVGELAPPLLAALAELVPLSARVAETRALADLVGGAGANVLRMTLTSFVLAARLEEVAAAASERLLRMTQGRYALVHTDAGRGGARHGLGLLARDSWTGQDRDTCTLSGGETFLASLALALGLADVVTAEAGGAPIEALFVDEGFGTLDEETLDEVMDVLDGLREGGRVVGVVSHVAELRQRIPSQVQVRKGRSGSDLTVVG